MGPTLISSGVRSLGRWLPTVAFAAFVLSILPVLIWYGRRMGDGSDEPLGVVALIAAVGTLLVAGFLGKRDRRQIAVLPLRLVLGAVILGSLQAFELVRYPLVIAVLAVVVFSVSIAMPKGKAGVVALLILSLPVLASLDFYAGYPLRRVAAEITTALLAVGGIDVERVGLMLIDGDRLVGIDPACAGIRMLWTSCFVAALLSARMRLSWVRTLALIAVAIGCVVLGNGLRAAIVFFPESGRVVWPEWAHPGVGLLVHGCVLAAVFWMAGRVERYGWVNSELSSSPKLRRFVVVGVGVLFVSGGLLMQRFQRDAGVTVAERPWPTMLEGLPLVPQPLSAMELNFSRAFPGEIAKFSWGDAEVIMRRADHATRMMHPSGDCLRAAGFEIHTKPVFLDADDRWWGASIARRDGRAWTVHERYESSSGESVTDASAWYWQALINPDQGPWLATTVIRPEDPVSRAIALK